MKSNRPSTIWPVTLAKHRSPHALEWEKQETIPKPLWTELAQLGFGGLYVREENGGSGLSRLDATLVFEALAKPARQLGLPVDPQHVRLDD